MTKIAIRYIIYVTDIIKYEKYILVDIKIPNLLFFVQHSLPIKYINFPNLFPTECELKHIRMAFAVAYKILLVNFAYRCRLK